MPADAVAMIAEACNVSRADVHGVFTFMQIRDTAPPAVPVRLCATEACQAVGGRELKAEWAKACGDDADWPHSPVSTSRSSVCNCALGPAAGGW